MALDSTVSESVSFPVLAAGETAGATVSVTAGATVATWQNKCKSTQDPKFIDEGCEFPVDLPTG